MSDLGDGLHPSAEVPPRDTDHLLPREDEQHVKCEHDPYFWKRHIAAPIRCPDKLQGQRHKEVHLNLTSVRDGDTLVIVLKDSVDDEKGFANRVQELLPRGAKVLILTGDVEVAVVRGA